MSSNKFVKRFKYDRGPIFVDGVTIITDDNEGDCSSFAATVAFLESGSFKKFVSDLYTRKNSFWLARSPSNKLFPRHVVLHRKDKGYIDSTVRMWRDSPKPHKKKLPVPATWVLARLAWGHFVRSIVNLFS